MSLYSKALNNMDQDSLALASTKSLGEMMYPSIATGAGIGILGGAGIGAYSSSSDWSSGAFYGGVGGASLGALGGITVKNISNNFVRGAYGLLDEGIENFSNAKAVKKGKALRTGFWPGVTQQFLPA